MTFEMTFSKQLQMYESVYIFLGTHKLFQCQKHFLQSHENEVHVLRVFKSLNSKEIGAKILRLGFTVNMVNTHQILLCIIWICFQQIIQVCGLKMLFIG